MRFCFWLPRFAISKFHFRSEFRVRSARFWFAETIEA